MNIDWDLAKDFIYSISSAMAIIAFSFTTLRFIEERRKVHIDAFTITKPNIYPIFNSNDNTIGEEITGEVIWLDLVISNISTKPLSIMKVACVVNYKNTELVDDEFSHEFDLELLPVGGSTRIPRHVIKELSALLEIKILTNRYELSRVIVLSK